MTPDYAHRWRQLEPLASPARIENPELRAFCQLWRTQKARLTEIGSYHLFWERLARSWSIETGIIERIYDLSVGATQTLIEHGFAANLLQHADSDTDPERLIAILNDHRQGLGLVMDLVAKRRELTPGFIKELHALLCRHQATVTAIEQGPLRRVVEIPLQPGVYKTLPNNPTLADGRIHEYCPPEYVASEIESMIRLYGEIPLSLPEVRSAWLHHGFTQVHPFQDGNGRVARALASIDFIREGLFPLVVERGDRDGRYMPALRHADAGDLAPLVRMFGECEQRSIIQALSVAEDVITATKSRKSAIEAARDKVLSRARAETGKRGDMVGRLAALADAALATFKNTAREIEASVPGVKGNTARSTADNAHYWREQIVRMARARGYWADTREPRTWTRLQLKDGGITDLVIALHFVGNPSPGSCMSGAFLLHRDRADEAIAKAPFTLLPQEPLLLVAEEEVGPQRDRFMKWVEEAIVVALAEWKKGL